MKAENHRRQRGYTTVGDLEGCVHYKVGESGAKLQLNPEAVGNCEVQRGLHSVLGEKMVVFCCRQAMWTLTSTGSFSFLCPRMAIQDSGYERNSRM